jgi:hypothetical protein
VESAKSASEQARKNAEGLKPSDALRGRLGKLADQLDGFCSGITATSTAIISGEEKLREKLGSLYGAVNQYEGRPTASQLQRLDILLGELDQAAGTFDTSLRRQITTLNGQMEKQKLSPISVQSREEWKKQKEAGGSAAAGAGGHAGAWLELGLRMLPRGR